MDFNVHEQIVARAETLGEIGNRMDRMMDLFLVDDKNLADLQALLDSDSTTFAHDFSGIVNHLNRRTGTFDNGFSPRVGA
jgi:hypothetical protein